MCGKREQRSVEPDRLRTARSDNPKSGGRLNDHHHGRRIRCHLHSGDHWQRVGHLRRDALQQDEDGHEHVHPQPVDRRRRVPPRTSADDDHCPARTLAVRQRDVQDLLHADVHQHVHGRLHAHGDERGPLPRRVLPHRVDALPDAALRPRCHLHHLGRVLHRHAARRHVRTQRAPVARPCRRIQLRDTVAGGASRRRSEDLHGVHPHTRLPRSRRAHLTPLHATRRPSAHDGRQTRRRQQEQEEEEGDSPRHTHHRRLHRLLAPLLGLPDPPDRLGDRPHRPLAGEPVPGVHHAQLRQQHGEPAAVRLHQPGVPRELHQRLPLRAGPLRPTRQ